MRGVGLCLGVVGGGASCSTMATQCAPHAVCLRHESTPRLFAYDIEQVTHALGSSHPLEPQRTRISRSASGSAMHVSVEGRDGEPHTVFVISNGRRVERVDAPGFPAFIDDRRRLVAWTRPSAGELMMEFADGFVTPPIGDDSDVDPSGRYYVAARPGRQIADVGRIERSAGPIGSLPIFAKRVFAADAAITVLGYRRTGDEREQLVAYVLQETAGGLRVVDEVLMPAPASSGLFFFEDFDPRTGDVLILARYDWLSADTWYLFNLRSKTSARIGRARRYGLFLVRDVLE